MRRQGRGRARPRRLLLETMDGNELVFDDAAGDEVFLNDALEDRRIAFAIPGALGIHDGDRTAFADAETVRLRAQNSTLLGQAELLETPLQKIPRREPAILLAAFRRGLIAAKKNVATRHRHADRCGDRALRFNTQ